MIAKNKALIFAAGWFLIWLLPFSGILRLNSDVAGHWLYIGSFGFFLIAGHCLLRNKLALTILLLFLGIITVQRNFIWHSDISIYKDTLKYRPNDYKLHYNLGNAYLRRGMLSGAYKEYNIALRINPAHSYTLNNLRLIFDKIGDSYAFADEAGYFDHHLYAEVLKACLKDGNVDYRELKKNSSGLTAYLKKAAELNAQPFISMSEEERMAFYLNIYNAITLKMIIENYPVKSIKDIPGVWDKIKFNAAGRNLTLNQIEHQILRKEFKEPRIHFVLVCASKGCPELASEPFSGKVLDEQLDREARKFVNDKTKVRLDRDNKTLYISLIFKWFNEDFGDSIKFISKYLSEDDAEFIKKAKPKIKYLNYDWSLNEKP
jgi:tetratricopeptide (TPR) repeat protein